jgi:D-serine deaminase-like pyridoxal phosphate-dependent protein
MEELVGAILQSPATSLHGFYAHAGNAYGSTSLTEAQSYLSGEVRMVNDSAGFALEKYRDAIENGENTSPLVLSVGSTPTAHASSSAARERLEEILHGALELHAGNYPVLDLQQQHTSLIDYPRVAQRVRSAVVSYYPGRGKNGEDEALIDAGAIAFSKDTGPSGTFGEVVGKPWVLGKTSQEHGILSCTDASDPRGKLEIGDLVDIIGQHACLIAAVCLAPGDLWR